jgi:hypothetical protein
MDLLQARVALRPRSMSDVLDLAAPFCISNRRLLFPLTLLTTAIGGVLAGICRLWLDWTWAEVWLLTGGYWILCTGLFTSAAGELLFREPSQIRVRAVLGRFLRRFVPYLAARILQWLVLGVGAILLVPLPIFASRLLFVSESVLLESGSPTTSLARSSQLVLFRSGPCLGLAAACALCPLLSAVVAEVVGGAIVGLVFEMGQPFGSLWWDGGSAFAVVGVLLSVPLVATASFLGYIDMRTRKEGWDIQLRFMALAEAEARRVAR